MKIYFASRFKYRGLWREKSPGIELLGHKVVSSWIWKESQKPYNKYEENSAKIAQKVEEDIKSCDTFVMLSDEGGTDMFVELGIALALDKKVFVVGDHVDRSLMHFHPKIIKLSSINEFFKIL